MTFTQIVDDIMDRLNLSSTTAETRIGRAVNRTYRKVTTAIGMQLSRRGTVQATVTPGVNTVTFTNVEKLINVQLRTVTPYRFLTEVSLEEIQEENLPFSDGDSPTQYAIHNQTADTVVIRFNCTPVTGFVLYADAHQVVADLSGSNEPAFPESFHDVIIEGVMADELRKLEKPQLAAMAQKEYDRILSDLKFWMAKTSMDQYSGKIASTRTSGGGSGGSGTFNGAQSWTQTGTITVDTGGVITFGSNGSLILPRATTPAQTTDGSVVWDSDHDYLTIGNGTICKGAGNYVILGNGDTGTQNAWTVVSSPALKGHVLVEWVGASDATINGISGGTVGQYLTIKNTGSGGNMMFVHQSGSASAGNKIFTDGSSNYPIGAGGYMGFVYDGTNWVYTEHNQGTPISFTPVATFATPGNQNITYAGRNASYMKIGRQVTLWIAVDISSLTHTTASGSLLFTGNPWSTNIVGLGGIYFSGPSGLTATSFVSRIGGVVGQPATVDIVATQSGAAAVTITTAHITSGGAFSFFIVVTFFV